MWIVTAQACDADPPVCTGIAGCDFGVVYSGFPAIDPATGSMVSAIYEDPPEHGEETDFGTLRLEWIHPANANRDPQVIYPTGETSCARSRRVVEQRIEAVNDALATLRSLSLLAGAPPRNWVSLGGPAPVSPTRRTLHLEDATLVLEEEGVVAFRISDPFLEGWDEVDALYGDLDTGLGVICLRAYDPRERDVVHQRVITLPPGLLSAHEP